MSRGRLWWIWGFCLICSGVTENSHTILLLHEASTASSQIAFKRALESGSGSGSGVAGVSYEVDGYEQNPISINAQICEILKNHTISGIIGLETSDQTLTAAYMASALNIPIISPTATAGLMLEKGDWTKTLLRMSPPNSKMAHAITDFVRHFQWSTIAIIHTTDIYGISLALYVIDHARSNDMKILVTVPVDYNARVKEVRSALREKIRPIQPKIILLLASSIDTKTILAQAFDMELVNDKTVWILGDSGVTYLRKLARDDTALLSWHKGIFAVDQSYDRTDEDIIMLQAEYLKNKTRLGSYALGTYYAAHIFKKALAGVATPSRRPTCADLTNNNLLDHNPDTMQILRQTVLSNERHLNISFSASGDISGSRFAIMNFNGLSSVQIGEWRDFGYGIKVTHSPTFRGAFKPSDVTDSIQYRLKLGVVSDPPFLIIKDKNTTGCVGSDCYEGFCVDLIISLQQKLGFEFDFVESYDGKFGALNEDLSWNGLVKMLIDKDIHVATVGLGTSSKREQVIDFSAPMLDGGVYILSKKEIEKRDSFFFMQPFTDNLWIALLVVGILATAIIWLLDKCSLIAKLNRQGRKGGLIQDNPQYVVETDGHPSIPLKDTAWLVVCSVLGTAPVDQTPRSWGSRLVLTGWWICCLIIISTYTADLAAYLTVSRMKKGFSSLEDIRSTVGLNWGTVEGSVTELLLKSSNIKQHRDLMRDAVNVRSFGEGLSRVKDPADKYVFLYGIGPLEYAAGKVPCNTEVLNIPLISFGYAFAFPQNSPYRDPINRAILEMQESGLIIELWNSWTKSQECSHKHFTKVKKNLAVDINKFVDLIWIITPLGGASFLIILSEYCIYWWKNR